MTIFAIYPPKLLMRRKPQQMNVAKKTNVALCPDCEEEISFNVTPKMGQKFSCPNCETPLEVVSLRPLEVDWDDDSDFEQDSWDDDSDW